MDKRNQGDMIREIAERNRCFENIPDTEEVKSIVDTINTLSGYFTQLSLIDDFNNAVSALMCLKDAMKQDEEPLRHTDYDFNHTSAELHTSAKHIRQLNLTATDEQLRKAFELAKDSSVKLYRRNLLNACRAIDYFAEVTEYINQREAKY